MSRWKNIEFAEQPPNKNRCWWLLICLSLQLYIQSGKENYRGVLWKFLCTFQWVLRQNLSWCWRKDLQMSGCSSFREGPFRKLFWMSKKSPTLALLCRSLGLLRNMFGHWTKSFMENFERSKATRQKFEGFKSLSLVLFKSRTSSIISKIKFALFQQKFYMKYTNILFQCTSPITSTFSGWHRRTWTSPWVFLTRTLFQRSLHITLNFNAWLGGRRKIVIPILLPHTRIFNFWQNSCDRVPEAQENVLCNENVFFMDTLYIKYINAKTQHVPCSGLFWSDLV